MNSYLYLFLYLKVSENAARFLNLDALVQSLICWKHILPQFVDCFAAGMQYVLFVNL